MQVINQHDVAPLVEGFGEILQVREIFPTIQGEGPFSGMRSVFVRLSGCPLRCWWCDTEWDDANDPKLEVGEIVEQVWSCWRGMAGGSDPELVVLTGGEPLRQPLRRLIMGLLGFPQPQRPSPVIQIETAGIIWQECLDDLKVRVVVSPKTPKIDPKVAEIAYAFKYVIRAADEFDSKWGVPTTSTQVGVERGACLATPPSHLSRSRIYLSPCDEQDPDKNQDNLRKAAQLAMKYGYRLQVQVHKIAGLR